VGATTTEGTGPGSVDKILPTIKNGKIYLSNIINIKSLLEGVLVLEEFEPSFSQLSAPVENYVEKVQKEQVEKKIQISQSFKHNINVHHSVTIKPEAVLPLSLDKKESYKVVISKQTRSKNKNMLSHSNKKQTKQRRKVILEPRNKIQKKQRKKIISSEVLLIGNNQKVIISKNSSIFDK
jgi:hypothetical protein